MITLLIFSWLLGCEGEITPTPACEAYVACLSARDEARGLNTDMVRFEAGGACWGSHESAEFCDGGCARGLAWLQEAEADTLPGECAP